LTNKIRDDEPLSRHLADDLTEVEVQRLWQRTAPAVTRAPRERWRAPVFVLAACTVVLAIWGVHASLSAAPESEFLAMRDGSPLVAITAEHARDLAFSDGSRAVLSAGTHLSPTVNRAGYIELALESGDASFEVEPGGPRRWHIVAGEVEVEVVGTAFTVVSAPSTVEVSVVHGIVRVSGGTLSEPRLLTAGESLSVARTEAPITALAPSEVDVVADAADPTPEPDSVATTRAAPTRRRDTSSWTALAESGEHERAWEALGPSGVRAEARGASPRELLLLADVARLSGHPQEAVEPLELLLSSSHAGSREAPLAAITLGRLELHELGHPREAAHAFERAIASGVPAAFDEEVRADLAIAFGRSGETERAARAADAYFERYPNGARAARVAPWRTE